MEKHAQPVAVAAQVGLVGHLGPRVDPGGQRQPRRAILDADDPGEAVGRSLRVDVGAGELFVGGARLDEGVGIERAWHVDRAVLRPAHDDVGHHEEKAVEPAEAAAEEVLAEVADERRPPIDPRGVWKKRGADGQLEFIRRRRGVDRRRIGGPVLPPLRDKGKWGPLAHAIGERERGPAGGGVSLDRVPQQHRAERLHHPGLVDPEIDPRPDLVAADEAAVDGAVRERRPGPVFPVKLDRHEAVVEPQARIGLGKRHLVCEDGGCGERKCEGEDRRPRHIRRLDEPWTRDRGSSGHGFAS